MSNDKINRALAEAMGLHWHIPYPIKDGSSDKIKRYACDCGENFGFNYPAPPASRYNPDYCNDISACLGNGGLVEWMRREKGVRFEIETRGKLWVVFISEPSGSIRPFVVSSGNGRGASESLPTAISLAAARALGISLETKAEAL